jgi:hypothetical protein
MKIFLFFILNNLINVIDWLLVQKLDRFSGVDKYAMQPANTELNTESDRM